MACIYKITNLANGKMYVGQTGGTLSRRWGQHKAARNKAYVLYAAMRKYGVENFTVECLQECAEEELDALEKYWIKKLDTYNNGYNSTEGGKATKITSRRPDAIDLRKPVVQYTMDGKFIARYNGRNEAALLTGCRDTSISSCCCGRRKSANGYIFFYEDEPERIERILSKSKRRTSKNSYIVQQFSLDGELIAEYESANEAGRLLGITVSRICSCCRGEQKTCKGYKWKYKI